MWHCDDQGKSYRSSESKQPTAGLPNFHQPSRVTATTAFPAAKPSSRLRQPHPKDEKNMEPTLRPRMKVCCMGSVEETRLAVRYGAAAVGLVAEMPSGPGVIPEPLIAEIAATVPPSVGSFLLTSHQHVHAIIEQQRRCRVNTLQIVDRLEEGRYDDLRMALPGVSIVQVIHITGEEAFAEACRAAEEGVDGLLLDSGDQRLDVKLLGGTGRTHNWAISRRIREAVTVPLFLAGGLRPENVAEAIQAVRPFGVDVCSGLRTNGRLDEGKLAEFFETVEFASAPA
jgi:phosphoribosylanthranilate isomerase